MNELLLQGLSELGLDVSRAETLERFSSLLLEKNQVMNLTAITEPDAVAQLHLLDSAALLPFVDLTGKTVVDVGTGAGFPGMPLRILKDDFDLTLLDSLGKRVNWLQEVCDELQLKRVACVHARAEEFAMQHREQFDIATSRAVAQLSILSELCLPLIKVGGQFAAMKSVDTEDEIAAAKSAIKTLGGHIVKVEDYTIPTSDVVHRLVIVEKVSPTPARLSARLRQDQKSPAVTHQIHKKEVRALSQVIAVVSGKGGTGKTSFTTLTGMALAQLGKKTLLLDCDIGLRNLDLYLGVSDRALMDFTDVIAGRTTLAQAVVRHPLYPNLYLLTAPVSFGVRLPSKREMQRLIDEIRRHFDFCLIDAAAGIGEAFALATCCADRAVVVTTNDPSSLRDAQRTVMELHRFPSGYLHLVVNRVRRKLLQSLHTTIDDAIDAAGLPLLGVIPEDENVPAVLGRGLSQHLKYRSGALCACENIARRLCGERVRLMRL